MRANDPGKQNSNDAWNVPCFNEALVGKLRRSLPADTALSEAVAVFGALSDRTRLRLLHVLRSGDELCVCDVAHVLGISVSTASHHLRKLRDLEILAFRNDGKMAYYRLNDRSVAKLVRQALQPSEP